jgi:ribonuclease D
LAIDTESNSLYAYREQVCLIQISIPGCDYIVDPLTLPKIDELGELMADPSVEKIFHAAEYDLLCLKRDFGYSFSNLFDTMLAARILGRKKVGLAAVLEEEFGIRVNKRYQRANWGRRPLKPEQIAYARQDTHYLIPIRDKMEHELEAAGRMAEARASFAQTAKIIPHPPRTFDPDDFWSLLNGRYQLEPQQHAVLRQLYILREREAQRRNLPPFKILGNLTLIELAEELPYYTDEFQGIHGLTPRVINRYGHKLLRAIRKGLREQPPRPPARQARQPESVRIRYDALRNWRKQRATQRGVESDIIVSRKALWELAAQNPKCVKDLLKIKSLGEWQRNEYGREIVTVLAKTKRTTRSTK